MNIAFYNQKGIGDTLLVTLKKSTVAEQSIESVGHVTRIFNEKTNETVGYNFFHISELLAVDAIGQVPMTEALVSVLNEQIKKAGWADLLVADETSKFVVGDVKECIPHPDSDHLSITQIEVDNGEVLQIVCGASNIAKGQKVVVAKEGAVMPSGIIIWEGALRGEESQGMVCSARELGLTVSIETKGILVLADSVPTGEAFREELI